MVFDWGFRCFSDIEGNITNKSIYAFSFLVGKHREPQSINAKLFLPIIPIGIVAYTLTLLWDNLCRNSCIINVNTYRIVSVLQCKSSLNAVNCEHVLSYKNNTLGFVLFCFQFPRIPQKGNAFSELCGYNLDIRLAVNCKFASLQ